MEVIAAGATTGAIVGGAVTGGVSEAAFTYFTTRNIEQTKTAFVEGAADGFMWGAIEGVVTGGVTSAKCFVAGTVVCTLQGDIFIENIQEGDYVLSTDPDTGDTTYKMVLETYQNEVTQLVHVYTEVEEIITTLTHPFYEADEGWTNAADLEKGDDLCLSDGSIAKVSDVTVEYLDTPVTVYNFAVEDYHTYYVGEADVLVHNSCGVPVSSKTKAGNGLFYKSNSKHTIGQMGNRPNAGIEPTNSLKLFENSVLSQKVNNQRFAYDKATNTLHRFFFDGIDTWHWSGSTNQGINSLVGKDVPIDIKRLFGLPKKGW